jgi:hypothetical protein
MSGNLRYMPNNPVKLGEWIRLGLEDINKSQVWLAEKIGVQPPQVSRIISGRSETSPDILSAIFNTIYLTPLGNPNPWSRDIVQKLGAAGRTIPRYHRNGTTRFISTRYSPLRGVKDTLHLHNTCCIIEKMTHPAR